MKKKRQLRGVLLIIAALLIMQLPVSEVDAATASASDFQMEGSTLVKYRGKETSVTIPDTVEVIGESAFEDNKNVELVVVPNSVTRIEAYAFWGCDNLETVVLGKGLNAVGDYAFADCTGLKDMSIPSNIQSIGIGAFEDCVNLKDIKIPPETTDIHETAFNGCKKLTIHCEAGTVADKYAQSFYERQKEMPEYEDVPDCNNGQDTTDASNKQPENQDTSAATPTPVPAASTGTVLGSTQIVGNQAVVFMDNTLPIVLSSGRTGSLEESTEPVGNLMDAVAENGISKYTIVDGKVIADQAYYRSQELGDVAVPAGITQIGQFAFARSSVTSVSFPQGVAEIDYGAFYHCDALDKVSLPDSVAVVEPKAFTGTLWEEKFLAGEEVEGDETPGDDYLVSGGVLAAYRGTAAQVEIPDGVRVIAAEAFQNHAEIESVLVPDSVLSIGEGAFENCSSLRSVTLGNQVAQIKDRAFQGCDIAQIQLPETIKEVGLEALGDASVSFAGEAFEIPNHYETSATRLSNADYRLTGQEQTDSSAGVTVTGLENAYADLAGADTGYTLTISQPEDISSLEQACSRSFQSVLPEETVVYDLQLTDSSEIPIHKLGHQTLTVVLPIPENLQNKELQVITLDRNLQPELLPAERVIVNNVESVRFQTNHLSLFGIYSLGETTEEEILEVSVDMISQSSAPAEQSSGYSIGKIVQCLAAAILFTAGAYFLILNTLRRFVRK